MTKTRVVKKKIKPENKPIKSPINKSVCAGLPVQEEGKQRAEQHEGTENVRGGIKGRFQNFQSCRSRSTAGDCSREHVCVSATLKLCGPTGEKKATPQRALSVKTMRSKETPRAAPAETFGCL